MQKKEEREEERENYGNVLRKGRAATRRYARQ